MESAKVRLWSFKKPPCTLGPPGSQTETSKASGGGSLEHITLMDFQKNVKKEETVDKEYSGEVLSGSVGHITPVDQENHMKKYELEDEDNLCDGTSNSVENVGEQSGEFERKHIKKEESEDEDYLCTTTDWG
ncbi:hypothetical protein AMELA_G00283460 [Ameiurus melas]|uniref:Uncharacterized protein n=1 Tax=Ameiurus melas TaxID=219545 RepID=A0A7J5ZPT6_AMEME|nr:hypothetical protein AMELA_G00283460 [Ameiurus melas]